MKKILITGGSGFLAGKLYDYLKNSFDVILGVRNTPKLKNYPPESVRHFDIADSSSFSPSLVGIDGVIHLAAMDFQDCQKDPELAQKINVDQTKVFSQLCHKSGVKKFIYFSTIHVYGPHLTGTITEETKPNPVNTYSKTHLLAEDNVLKNQGIVIRLSNAIGLPMFPEASAWKLVMMDLCRQAVLNQKIVLQSSGRQFRDFIPAPSVGEAVKLLLTHQDAQGIYNVGGDRSLSILEAAQLVQAQYQALFGSKIGLETKPVADEKILEFHYSINKIKQLGFSPSSLVESQITDMLRSLKKP